MEKARKAHGDLKDKATAAIDKLHSDTSVDQETTRKSLESLVAHINTLIESLDEIDD